MTDHNDLREWLRSLDKGERKVVKSEPYIRFIDHDYHAHSDERSKAIWNSLKPKRPNGRGPHLLTARDGSQEYCGGPGLCKYCDQALIIDGVRK